MESKELLRVDVEGGKYTVVMDWDGRLHALRGGKPWMEIGPGSKMIIAMAGELETLRRGFKGAEQLLANSISVRVVGDEVQCSACDRTWPDGKPHRHMDECPWLLYSEAFAALDARGK